MKKSVMRFYSEFNDRMILRDYLALDRTILANKRTILAYFRTFIGLVASGTGMIKLVATPVITVIGYVFIILAFPLMITGIIEFLRVSRSLSRIVKTNE